MNVHFLSSQVKVVGQTTISSLDKDNQSQWRIQTPNQYGRVTCHSRVPKPGTRVLKAVWCCVQPHSGNTFAKLYLSLPLVSGHLQYGEQLIFHKTLLKNLQAQVHNPKRQVDSRKNDENFFINLVIGRNLKNSFLRESFLILKAYSRTLPYIHIIAVWQLC